MDSLSNKFFFYLNLSSRISGKTDAKSAIYQRMDEGILLIGVFAAGMLLGAFYYGGLLLTLKKLPQSKRPNLIIFMSWTLRLGLAAAFLYFLAAGRSERLLFAMGGFILVRFFFAKRLRPGRRPAAPPPPDNQA